MGEIVASMEMENTDDRGVVRQGLRDESTVRRATVDGGVDTGAVMRVLPEDVVGRLGLATQREVVVTYANEHRETRPVAGPSPAEAEATRTRQSVEPRLTPPIHPYRPRAPTRRWRPQGRPFPAPPPGV